CLKVMASRRVEVLALYRRVLRIARSWQAQSSLRHDTEKERTYITQEARSLFTQNKHLTDPELISKCVAECEARIELGLHYRNPYPRP
ncbi:LYR motif-containing protein 1, partial [Clarias magur]